MVMQFDQLYKPKQFGAFKTNGMNTAVILQQTMDYNRSIPATILFITTYKQTKVPDYLWQAEYDKTLSNTICAHGGRVMQAMPDKLIALFGSQDMSQQNAVHQAITAALAMVDQISTTNEYRLAAGRPVIRLGIGISTGIAALEQTSKGLQLAHFSDNHLLGLAQQLSNLNQQTPFPTAFISDETYHALLAHNHWHVENLGRVWLPEYPEAQTIHAVMRRPQFQ